jgi:hypothetical protein
MPKLSSCKRALIIGLLLVAADCACAKPIVTVQNTAATPADMLGAPEPESAVDGYQHEALMATMVCSILYGAKRFVRSSFSRAVNGGGTPGSKRRILL